MKKISPAVYRFYKKVSMIYMRFSVVLILAISILGFSGCNGTTSSPTSPVADIDTPTPSLTAVPTESDNPKEATPSEDATGSCDNFADHADDPDVEVLETDGTPLTITMECAGDVDWYKIELSQTPAELSIDLMDIPGGRDFDLILYDSQNYELENGRSAQSGSSDESVSLSVDDSEIYLQVYSFSGRGKATLRVTADKKNNGNDSSEDDAEDDDTEENSSEDDTEDEEEEEINQLTYEDVLSTYFWSYPRGNSTDLLERSVETSVERSLSCRLADSKTVSGVLTIGNYAHVERDLLQATDYIDGWALVVFNGSTQVLDMLKLTIRVTVQDESGLDVQVSLPAEMDPQSNDELASSREDNDVYYLSQSYGDLFGKSQQDLQIFSGVVGESGEELSSPIFEQQIEIEWEIVDEDGNTCSGEEAGKRITDFELGNFLLGSF